jgi:hypothetical protein
MTETPAPRSVKDTANAVAKLPDCTWAIASGR